MAAALWGKCETSHVAPKAAHASLQFWPGPPAMYFTQAGAEGEGGCGGVGGEGGSGGEGGGAEGGGDAA